MMSSKKLVFGIILVFLGAMLLLRTLDLVCFSFGEVLKVLLPLGLIVIGIWLIVRRRRHEREMETEMNFRYHTAHFSSDAAQAQPSPPPPPPPPQPFPSPTPPPAATEPTPQAQHPPETGQAGAESSQGPGTDQAGPQQAFYPGRAKYNKLFGDLLVDCCNVGLQNVEISDFVGDIEVRLHGATLIPGLNRMVISDFVGDIRVLVPRGMAVFANCSNFAGDIEVLGRRSSGLGNSLDGQTANYQDAESKLYIAANTFIGDIRVYEV